MRNVELLKTGRDGLLRLHKSLVDFERWRYEAVNGPVTPGQFLNMLLESPDLSWLRKFSTLIVDIDEMFAQKDGYSVESVETHLNKLRDLVMMKDLDEDFMASYQAALQQDMEAATKQAELRLVLVQE